MQDVLFCAVAEIVVDLGDISRTFRRGDPLVGVPAGTLESMVRLRQAVAEPPEPEEQVMPSGPTTDWRLRPLTDLEIDAKTLKHLAEAGLAVIGDLLRHGAEHGDLQGIKGIGEATERVIQAAVERLSTGNA